MCDQMGHSSWCRSHWLYGWLAAPLLHRLQIRRDANWLGLQPRVHKQEAMKGFDMQPRMAQSGQARVWLQTAAFYIPQSVGLWVPSKQNKMWRRMEWKKKSGCVWKKKTVNSPCIWSCLQEPYPPWRRSWHTVGARTDWCCSVETFSWNKYTKVRKLILIFKKKTNYGIKSGST